MIGIYKITSPSGKVYIGQSWDVQSRFWKYRGTSCRKQKHIYASIQKYGWKAHKFDLIHELPADITQEILDNYEILYWELYKDCRIKMLNIKEPGVGGKHSKESIEKMKKNSLLTGKKGANHPAFGRKDSEETIEKRISQRRGENHPMFGRKPSLAYYEAMKLFHENGGIAKKVLNTETGKIYKSIVEAAKEEGISYSTLAWRLRNPKENTSNLRYYDSPDN